MDVAQTVARALGLLELLGKHKKLTAGKITELTQINRSTTYRLLATLQQLGYIRKDKEFGFYSLSPKILNLASSVRETRDIKEISSPFLNELHKETQETVHLAVLDVDELIYLEKRESTKSLRVVTISKPGSHAPLYCTAIGKVLLSGMPDDQFRNYIKTVQFRKYTDSTLTGIQELITELDVIKDLAYAEDREEHEEGVYCIAAPIKDPTGKTIAAFSISMPTVRCTPERKAELIERIVQVSQKISGAVG